MGGDSKVSESGNCFTCQARGRTEWCVLSDEELEVVNNGKVCREYMPGEMVFHEGDDCRGIHCIEQGLIAWHQKEMAA